MQAPHAGSALRAATAAVAALADRKIEPPRTKTDNSAGEHKHGQRGAPALEGDVSEWGRTQLDSFYEESGVGTEVSEMSSGISPRDLRPQGRPFDMEEATQTLAYQSDMYSRAQALRRDGCAPAAMGVPDDLPTRMAYQQLNALAGMAGKVQDAILHNKRIFEQRMMQEGRALQRRVLHGWGLRVQHKAAKQARLVRAQGRLQRGLLLRVFFSWKDELHQVDKTLVMKRKVAVATARGCVRRCFLAWLFLARERWYKSQMCSMESQVGLMEAKLRGYEKRPIQVLRKRRLSHLLAAWLVEAVWSRHKRQRAAKAVAFCSQHTLCQAWCAWGQVVSVKAWQREVAQRVTQRSQHIKQQAAWDAWLQAIDCQHHKQQQLRAAAQHYQRAAQLKAWRAWQGRAKQHRRSRAAANRWKRPCLARAFKFWLAYAGKRQWQKVVLARAQAKRQQKLLQAAFCCWVEYVQSRHLKSQLGEKASLQDELERLKAENARLQRDNERFVRLVDSGEWGRGRVAELTAAGELMRAERDALLKLVQALRHEYEAVQLAKEAQHDELRTLKDKMTVKGAARNCLLVKGGSSFNALVRALKQDLIDSGTASKDPALLYQIDKLSLDRVHVYPDGELNIQAVASGPQAPGKGRTQLQQPQHSQPGSPSRARTQSPHATCRGPDVTGPSGDTVKQHLRVTVGAYGPESRPGSSPGGAGSLTSSPTRMACTPQGAAAAAAAAGGAFFGSPTAAAAAASGVYIGSSTAAGAQQQQLVQPTSPLRQQSAAATSLRLSGGSAQSAAVAAAAAAAAAAVVSGRVGTTGLLQRGVSAPQGACTALGVETANTRPQQGLPSQQQQRGAPKPATVPTDSMLQALASLSPAQVQQRLAGAPRLLSTTAPADVGLVEARGVRVRAGRPSSSSSSSSSSAQRGRQ